MTSLTIPEQDRLDFQNSYLVRELTKLEVQNHPTLETSVDIFLQGKDAVAVGVLNRLKTIAEDSYANKVFSTHFQFKKLPEPYVAKPNLLTFIDLYLSDYFKFLKSHTELGLVEPNIEMYDGALWWDTAPVEFTYLVGDPNPYRLTFANGRSLQTTSAVLSQYPELSHNLQLSVYLSLTRHFGFEFTMEAVKVDPLTACPDFTPALLINLDRLKQSIIDRHPHEHPDVSFNQNLNYLTDGNPLIELAFYLNSKGVKQ